MVDGWPGRVSRDNWGPHMSSEMPQRNTKNSLNEKQVNLEFWQQAGMSLVLPKAVMHFDDNEGLDFKTGLFAWDQTIYTDFNTPDFLTFTFTNNGDYLIEFADEVFGRPDQDGVQQLEPLNFQFGLGDATEIDAQRVYVNVELNDPQTLHINTWRAAGLVEVDFALAVW